MWEKSEDSLGKEHCEETDDKEEKPDEETQKPKDEEEHVISTLHTNNQLVGEWKMMHQCSIHKKQPNEK